MLRLSKKADYALIALKDLASKSEGTSSSAREIAARFDIPIELMAKVLQRLSKKGLLVSHQGTRGGYRLSRTADQISVADVIVAIDGPVMVTACSDGDESCDQYSKCNIRDPLWQLKDRIVSSLESFSLKELADDRTGASPVVFTNPRHVPEPASVGVTLGDSRH